ncbi:MAG: DNA-directed DNA polymerase II small subunit [Candidatus Bathyarchaeia archaeon]
MVNSERLQKALEITISSGYQLSREAFDFLKLVATTEDPVEVINKALETVKIMKNRPLFIERSLLEDVIKFKENEEGKKASEDKQENEQASYMLEGKGDFHPYAKDVEADIKIIEHFSEKMNAGGNIEDYIEYFRDRLRRLERILRQRIDVKSATSIIEALKAPQGTKLKIIGIITEKKEQKDKIILTVEDLTATATVFVTDKNSKDLIDKARLLLIDQVVCLSIAKIKGSALIAEDIILPDVAKKEAKRASDPVYAVFTSDLHIGSVKFQKEAFNRFVLWLNGKYGDEKMRKIAEKVKYILIAGDIVDGIGIYPNQVKELQLRDIGKQYKLAAKFMEQIPDYIEIIIIPGNHDAVRKALPQPPIQNEFLENLQESRKIISVGNPCYLSIHGVEILMYHGRSLDDVISMVPGMSHSNPEKAMTLLLQSRHLAPVYGGKTPLSPEHKDFLVIERVPDIFHAGHIHTLGYTSYKGVMVINSGCWQEQTEYMRRLGVTPTPGIVPIVNLQTFEMNFISFT